VLVLCELATEKPLQYFVADLTMLITQCATAAAAKFLLLLKNSVSFVCDSGLQLHLFYFHLTVGSVAFIFDSFCKKWCQCRSIFSLYI